MAPAGVSGRWSIVAPGEESMAADLALRLGLKRVGPGDSFDWRLVRDEGLWRLEDADGRKLRIDFDGTGFDYRRPAPRGKNELLPRALGVPKGVSRIVDLSAGLGQDAVFLAALGLDVTAIERHPVLAALLGDARARTERPELEGLTIVAGEAAAILDGHAKFDAAYFDPMYPTKKKSALPRQEMVLFRGLVGDDVDADEVLALALERIERVVVKRPRAAPPLGGRPRTAFEGKTVRYDVYMR